MSHNDPVAAQANSEQLSFEVNRLRRENARLATENERLTKFARDINHLHQPDADYNVTCGGCLVTLTNFDDYDPLQCQTRRLVDVVFPELLTIEPHDPELPRST